MKINWGKTFIAAILLLAVAGLMQKYIAPYLSGVPVLSQPLFLGITGLSILIFAATWLLLISVPMTRKFFISK